MSLHFSSLNSGSNGNCYYIGNDEEAVLVDVGLSCREVEKRLARSGLNLHKIKAVFISHEHSDHIKGLPVFAKKHNIPVYISNPTRMNGKLLLNDLLTFNIAHQEEIMVGKLKVSVFSKFHDAADPYSFTIEYNDFCVGVFTDIGAVCDNLIAHFSKCNAAFLEANYDTEMLENGRYPYFLKRRIMGGKGHLSNAEALNLFVKHRPVHMSHLLLSHLSKDNNEPELVEKLFKSVCDDVFIKVASRYIESDVFFLGELNTNLRKTQLDLFAS